MGHRSMRPLFKRILSLGKKQEAQAEPPGTGEDTINQEGTASEKPTWTCFSYDEIHKATQGFRQDKLVGKGGCAEVYKGVLEDGREVAVKQVVSPAAAADERKEREFLTELGTVCHVRHENVSGLLGCCVDNGLHLVFQFSSHGSVASHLHDESSAPMPWRLRYRIAVGTAQGLRYLHKGCYRRIIHRDIKSSNILLTAEFEPQIADFGLARWLPTQCAHRAVAPIEGTFGYLAPEYFMHGIVDEKTDVFAFGVLLLELISGKKPVDGAHKSLLSWAKPYLNNTAFEELIDPRLRRRYDRQQLKRLAYMASLCVRTEAGWRPPMDEVLELISEDSSKVLPDCWKLPVEKEEAEFSGFDDLDDEDVEDLDDTSLSSVSSSISS